MFGSRVMLSVCFIKELLTAEQLSLNVWLVLVCWSRLSWSQPDTPVLCRLSRQQAGH